MNKSTTFKTIELFLSYYKKTVSINKIKPNVVNIQDNTHHHHTHHYRPTLLAILKKKKYPRFI